MKIIGVKLLEFRRRLDGRSWNPAFRWHERRAPLLVIETLNWMDSDRERLIEAAAAIAQANGQPFEDCGAAFPPFHRWASPGHLRAKPYFPP